MPDESGGVERKNSFPASKRIEGRDFRKEFKGSVLEGKARKTSRKNILHILLSKLSPFTWKKTSQHTDSSPSYIEALPPELLQHIFSFLDPKSARNGRAVCTRWQCALSHPALHSLFPIRTLSRLLIRRVARRSKVELRWVEYESQSSNVIVLPYPLSHECLLSFAFSQFDVQRIVLEAIPLTDALVHFLRINLLSTPKLAPLQLTLQDVDFSQSTALTLHRLLALMGRSLEVVELVRVSGLSSFHFSDAHISQLDCGRLRRVVVDGVSLRAPSASLALTDRSLDAFIRARNFPTLLLDKCDVTTASVVRYSNEWLGCAEEEGDSMHRHQLCTVKRCRFVNATHFEEQCSRRGLTCRRSSVTGRHAVYNIQSRHGHDEMTVTLSAAPSKQEEESAAST